MRSFDQVVTERFREYDPPPGSGVGPSISFKAKLDGNWETYNNCDDVWKFMLNRCEIKADPMIEVSKHVMILAMDKEQRDGKTTAQIGSRKT